jgi:hypothetical protein
VTPDDIAGVVAMWTGIPPTKLLASDRDRLLHLEDVLAERVVGQVSMDQYVSILLLLVSCVRLLQFLHDHLLLLYVLPLAIAIIYDTDQQALLVKLDRLHITSIVLILYNLLNAKPIDHKHIANHAWVYLPKTHCISIA